MFKKLTWQLFFQFVSCYSDKLRLLKRGIFKYSQSSNRGSHDVPQIWRPWGRVHCFLRQIHFRVPLLLLLPLLAIAFHWNLKKKLVHWFCLLQCTVLPNFPPVQEHSHKTCITDLGNRVFPPNSTPSRRGFRAKFSLRSFYFSLFSQTEFSSICLTSVKQRLVCTLHVAVCLFISNTEWWPQNVVGTKKMPSVPLMFLPYFDDFCDLLGRNRQMATWNMFFLYIIKNEKQNVVNGDVIYASFL